MEAKMLTTKLSIAAQSLPGAEIRDGYLVCPACGGSYTHHGAITVFNRGREDAPTCATRVEGENVSTLRGYRAECANPSSRRHGIVIQFRCEMCPAALDLTIAQHKGETLVEWRMGDPSLSLIW
jgi:hypothetical protein